MYHAASLLPGLAMAGLLRPKPVTVPDLVCDHLSSQGRVAQLMYKDSTGMARAQGALGMMKSLQLERAKAARLGCKLPKGM
jgi:hypothetical protein